MVVRSEIVMVWFMTRKNYERGTREMGSLNPRNENEAGVEVRRRRGENMTRGMTGEEAEGITEDLRGVVVETGMTIETEIGEERETIIIGREVDDELLGRPSWLC